MQSQTVEIQTLVHLMIASLVDEPEQVKIERLEDGAGYTLRVACAEKDIGKIIGKQGRTARSLRTILGAASMKFKVRYTLDIVEDSSPAVR